MCQQQPLHSVGGNGRLLRLRLRLLVLHRRAGAHGCAHNHANALGAPLPARGTLAGRAVSFENNSATGRCHWVAAVVLHTTCTNYGYGSVQPLAGMRT